MGFIENAEMVVALITGLVGLVGTAISTYFAIKNWVINLKTKNAQELWNLIMEVADKAMAEAEKSTSTGADKKEIVIQTVLVATKAAGIDMSLFLDQLSDYIDQSITFVNSMTRQ